MNWQNFQTYNDSYNKAFEAFCIQLFEKHCYEQYKESVEYFNVVNGSGGDGGVEAYATLINKEIIGLQAKWFRETLQETQFTQIRNSIRTALNIRSNIKKYIVCIPKSLGDLKIGPYKKVTKKTERSKWNTLLSELNHEYPNLEILLWDENQILNELQRPECCNIYRYWFQKCELDIDSLKYVFEKQKSGWLSLKYIPDLHSNGDINIKINQFLGNVDYKKELFNKINIIVSKHKKLLEIIANTEKWCKNSEDLVLKFNDIKTSAKTNIIILEKYKSILINNYTIPVTEKLLNIELKNVLEIFCKTNSSSSTYYYKLKNIIEEFNNDYWRFLENEIIEQTNNYLQIFIGDPGTGKTHGLANCVETILKKESHVAILIQAKSVTPTDEWKDILTKNLGLSMDWSEEEIFQALEALSYRLEVKNTNDQLLDNIPYTIPRVLICIDGLDELKPSDFWIDRLRETKVISQRYKRIKFCATTRPCVFDKLKFNDELRQHLKYLRPSGDVPVNELFEKYILYYNIKINGCNWLKWTIKTPLALKLFCDINKGKTITDIDRKSVTLSKLIREKIKIIDSEFRTLCNNYNENDNIIFNTLIIIGNYFLTNKSIVKNELIELLKKHESLNILANNDLSPLISILEENGFLQSYEEYSKDILSIKKVHYEKGIQPFFDYILAILLLNKYDNPKELKSSDALFEHEETLQTYAMMLLEEKQILISEIPIIREKIEPYDAVTFDFFALTNNDSELTIKYKPRILSFMKRNATHLTKYVNDIVLQVSKLENHPLGPILLHEFLSSFEKPITRDYYWCIQAWLRHSKNKIWENLENFELSSYRLTSEDKFNGLPLVYAWLLTNIDNKKRMSYRTELTKWGIQCPEEFCKLFDLTITTNDPQMKEELYAIAMGIVYSISDNINIIKHFISHIFNTIFKGNRSLTDNIAIRQYSRAITELAFQHKIITKEELNICIPPFKPFGNDISLSKPAMDGDRMGGYGPIGYDLSRYVLCDPISNLFFEKHYKNDETESMGIYDDYFTTLEIDNILKNHTKLNKKDKKELLRTKELRIKRELKFKNTGIEFLDKLEKINDEDKAKIEAHIDEVINSTLTIEEMYSHYEIKAQNLLRKASSVYNVEGILPDQFILAAAYAYLEQNGYKDETEDFDSSIQCLCSPATHGSKSNIMSICEKYIWCFKHEIYGYLNDRLDTRNYYSDIIAKIDDYSLIDTELINPIQETCEHNFREEMQNNEWFDPELLSPQMQGLSNQKEDIIKWVNTAQLPNFAKWINIETFAPLKQFNNKWNTISLFMVQKEPNIGVQTVFWINCCIIANNSFQYLIDDLKNKQQNICKLLNNPYDISSETLSYCYLSPKEICQMDWKHCAYEIMDNYTIANDKIIKYEIIKGTERCTVDYPDTGEESYTLPSKYLRKLLGIIDGDGSKYYDADNHIQSLSFSSGITWGEEQHLRIVNRDLLNIKLKENDMKIFWLCRVLREPSLECTQKYKDFYCHNDTTWITWEEDGHFNQICFSEDKTCSKI